MACFWVKFKDFFSKFKWELPTDGVDFQREGSKALRNLVLDGSNGVDRNVVDVEVLTYLVPSYKEFLKNIPLHIFNGSLSRYHSKNKAKYIHYPSPTIGINSLLIESGKGEKRGNFWRVKNNFFSH